MVDNIGLYIDDVDTYAFNQITDRLGVYAPNSDGNRKTMWYNMQIIYYPSQRRILLRNSLHKLYNLLQTGEDTNANDFCLSDLNHLTKLLGVYFDKDPEEFVLTGKLEFGLNIDTGGIKPFDIVERWLSCKCRGFYIINPKKEIPLQSTCYFTDYRIKGYDKSRLEGIRGKNIFRFEVVVQKLRKMRQIMKTKQLTLKELNDPDVWGNFYQYLANTYNSIKKAPLVTVPIPYEELFYIYAYINPLIAKDVKRTMKVDSYNKWRANAKRVYDRHSIEKTNFHISVSKMLEEKFIKVYNG